MDADTSRGPPDASLVPPWAVSIEDVAAAAPAKGTMGGGGDGEVFPGSRSGSRGGGYCGCCCCSRGQNGGGGGVLVGPSVLREALGRSVAARAGGSASVAAVFHAGPPFVRVLRGGRCVVPDTREEEEEDEVRNEDVGPVEWFSPVTGLYGPSSVSSSSSSSGESGGCGFPAYAGLTMFISQLPQPPPPPPVVVVVLFDLLLLSGPSFFL